MSNVFNEPFDPVSRVARIVCGVVLGFFSCVFLFGALWLAADMLTTRSLAAPGKSLWDVAAVIGAIGLGSSFITWRLLRGRKASNGVTLLPIFTLQLFGWLMAAFVVFLVIKGERSIMLIGSTIFAVLLITLGRRVATRRVRGHSNGPTQT
jgi:hypothetical protein